MRIALAQINPTVGALAKNKEKIVSFAQKAKAGGADLVVFPEMAITGYPPEDLLFRTDFIREALQLPKLAIPAIVGGVWWEDDQLYNAAHYLEDGKRLHTATKQFLPNYGVFDEHRYFAQGKELDPIMGPKESVLGLTICEDIWQPGGPATHLAAKGATVLINISASPYHVGKNKTRERMLSTRALDNMTWVIYCNQVGGQDELVFDGNSLVIAPDGKVIAKGAHCEEDLIFADIDLQMPTRSRLHDARYREYRQRYDLKVGGQRSMGQNMPPSATPYLYEEVKASISPEKELWDVLVLGLKDYLGKTGFKKIVLGLSGGLDSAIVAMLAKDALGASNVLCVSMPSKYNSEETKDAARLMAKRNEFDFKEIPIGEIFNAYPDLVKPKVAGENLQARIRGNLLMGISNSEGYLLLTTGNKSELSMGYATLYGDMAGGFAPISDLYKTQVRHLAKWRNLQEPSLEPIPDIIITRPPSAELAPDQEDTDSLPQYSELDLVLKGYLEEGYSPQEIEELYGYPWVRSVLRKLDLAEYKRRQYPPGIKVTIKAYGRDRRAPIVNSWLS